MKIFKPGTKTPEELKYEEDFVRRANFCAEVNKKYKYAFNKHHKIVAIRAKIPIYQVNNKTKEIIGSFDSMKSAAAYMGMPVGNFSKAMADRPIYKPVLIKGKWFIKQSHYGHWTET